MRHLAINILFLAALMGCATPYAVVEETDKFADPNKPARYALRSNDILRNEIGVSHGDLLDPYVERDRKTGKVVATGFVLLRTVGEPELVWTGAPKWLGIRPGDEIEFLADGERVALKALSARAYHNFGFYNGMNMTKYFDQAVYSSDPSQFTKITTAKNIEIKVNGMNGSEFYPRKGGYLFDSFTENLRQFYIEQVKPYL